MMWQASLLMVSFVVLGCQEPVASPPGPAHPAAPATSVPVPSARPSAEPRRIYCVVGTCEDEMSSEPVPMSAADEQKLLESIASYPPFSGYPYSGCHDRAHAMYLQLPAELQQQLRKVWLFAPMKTSVAGKEAIRFPLPVTEDSASWGYHVALAYKNPSDAYMVVDPVISSKALPLMSWFEKFQIPEHTYWIRSSGTRYLFYSTNWAFVPNPKEGKDISVFNGGFYDYEGFSRETELLFRNLARDAVGEYLLKNDGCAPAVKSHIKEAQMLLDWLVCATGTLPCMTESDLKWPSDPKCAATVRESLKIYEERLEFWRRQVPLPSLPKPDKTEPPVRRQRR